MAIDYSGFAFSKGTPRPVVKAKKRADIETADKKAKAAVMKRDKRTCRICGRPATEVHEALTFKSKGGVASLQNSIALCAAPTGLCHGLAQKHLIDVIGDDCSKTGTHAVGFEMKPAIAKLIFGRKPIPAHVRVQRPPRSERDP